MHKSSKAILLAIGFLLSLEMAAQDRMKSWTEWTSVEARKILTDSPWSKIQMYWDDTYGYRRLPIRVRLLSAKPVRQAFLRILQLSSGKMDPAKIDEGFRFVNHEYSQTVLIAVDCEGASGNMQASQAFRDATTAALKNRAYLIIEHGKQATLLEYEPPGDDGLGAKFIFPRFLNGDPLIENNTGAMTFRASLQNIYINVSFKIADLIFNGAMEY